MKLKSLDDLQESENWNARNGLTSVSSTNFLSTSVYVDRTVKKHGATRDFGSKGFNMSLKKDHLCGPAFVKAAHGPCVKNLTTQRCILNRCSCVEQECEFRDLHVQQEFQFASEKKCITGKQYGFIESCTEQKDNVDISRLQLLAEVAVSLIERNGITSSTEKHEYLGQELSACTENLGQDLSVRTMHKTGEEKRVFRKTDEEDQKKKNGRRKRKRVSTLPGKFQDSVMSNWKKKTRAIQQASRL